MVGEYDPRDLPNCTTPAGTRKYWSSSLCTYKMPYCWKEIFSFPSP